jgi:hypothetical protein
MKDIESVFSGYKVTGNLRARLERANESFKELTREIDSMFIQLQPDKIVIRNMEIEAHLQIESKRLSEYLDNAIIPLLKSHRI